MRRVRGEQTSATDDLSSLIGFGSVEGDMMSTKVEKRIVVDVPLTTRLTDTEPEFEESSRP